MQEINGMIVPRVFHKAKPNCGYSTAGRAESSRIIVIFSLDSDGTEGYRPRPSSDSNVGKEVRHVPLVGRTNRPGGWSAGRMLLREQGSLHRALIRPADGRRGWRGCRLS